jgi:hypothetical protein
MILHSLFLGASLTLGAITPAKVDNIVSNAPPSMAPPQIIYVSTFSTIGTSNQPDGDQGEGRPHLLGMFRGGEDNTFLGQRKEQQQADILQKLPGILQKALVQALNSGVARATAGDGMLATQANCWIVRGQFVIVDQGSRAMQAGVGFGAGQSHVEVRAQLYTLSDPDNPFLVFDTNGASGHMPGAVVIPNPYVAAAKFVMAKQEPEKETKKIGKQMAVEIGKFMTHEGIPTLKAMQSSGTTPPPPAPDSDSNSTPVYSSKGG